MKNSEGLSVALTHVFKGAARFTALDVSGRRRRRPPFEAGNARRRAQLIERLCREYTLEQRENYAASSQDDLLPSDSWINQMLSRLGEPWRVHSVDGYRYELYEAT